MYDPLLGRFMSAAPTIPDVYNPQSLNRYSYVLNNPFRYVDPTGYYHESTGVNIRGNNYLLATDSWYLSDGSVYIGGEGWTNSSDVGTDALDAIETWIVQDSATVGEEFSTGFSIIYGNGDMSELRTTTLSKIIDDPVDFYHDKRISSQSFKGLGLVVVRCSPW